MKAIIQKEMLKLNRKDSIESSSFSLLDKTDVSFESISEE